MAQSIRYHLDENVSDAIAFGLRHHGVDVTLSKEAGLLSASDEVQLAYCRQERRMLFTHDEDFLRLSALGIGHCGIVYCHQESHTIGQIINLLKLIWVICEPEEKENSVEYL